MRQTLPLLALVTVVLSCSGTNPGTPTCQANADCPAGKVCEGGSCVDAPPPAQCTTGETRACGPDAIGECKRGSQRCVDGKWETQCTGAVQPTAETCNGKDDNCDGQVDEGAGTTYYVDADGDGYGSGAMGAEKRVACSKPTGFAAGSDDCNDAPGSGFAIHPGAAEVCDAQSADENCDGQQNEGCACTAGMTQACCAGRGMQTCEVRDGGAALSACSVQSAPEACNNVDDDCDGQTDEGAAVTAADGGVLMLNGGGVALADGTCTVGVGACAASGTTSCASGALACSASPRAAGTETCNNVDDDCDGQTDEAGPGLCAVTGQQCANGACSCPSGQSVCNGVCVTLSAEVCDGVDNDCDGQIDETLTIACSRDPDGDGYATDATTSQQCPNVARPAAGNCPAGYVAPASSTGIDCSPMNANLYRQVSSRADADADTYCAGAAANDCVGATSLAGRRFAASCAATDDCNDAAAAVYRVVPSRTNADGDSFCVGATTNDCVGATALPGRTFAASCQTDDDCNDGDASRYHLIASRNDVDGDNYCAGPVGMDCVGGTALPGRRFDQWCVADDCDDSTNTKFRIASLRSDSDGDTYCAGAATNTCIGLNAPAGYRLTSQCAGDDCRDSNSAATTACTLPGQYYTSSHGQTCPNGPQTFSLAVQQSCPLGFIVGGYRVDILNGAGNCSANSPTIITQSCNFLEGTTCRIVGDCVAL